MKSCLYSAPIDWRRTRRRVTAAVVTAAVVAGVFGASAPSATAAPSIVDMSPPAGAVVDSLTSLTLTFNEPVTGFEAADLAVAGRTPAGLTGSGAGPYTLRFSEPEAGTVAVSWDADHDIAGVGTGAFAPTAGWTYELNDTRAPSIARVLASVAGQDFPNVKPFPGATVSTLTEARVTFSESVTGVTPGALRINGVAAESVAGDGAGVYLFQFPQPPPGPVTFEWATDSGITDETGLPFNGGASGWSVTRVAALATVVISEFLAANGGVLPSPVNGLRDDNFDASPWVELTNAGTTSVDLAGWSLSRSIDGTASWVLPSRVLGPGERLIIWCSGKNRRPTSGHLHADFEPDIEGGTLALFTADSPAGPPTSTLLDYPPQRFDHSFGRQSGDGALRYFSPPSVSQTNYTLPTSANPSPTPPAVPQGQPNPTSALLSILAPPTASVGRGLFDQPIRVILSAEAGASIHYTFTGNPPTASDPVYSEPLVIASTTILRATAMAPGRVPSATVTHSYLFPDAVVAQPSPPYDNPASSTDDTNPDPPAVGGTPLPVHWGTNGTGGFPGVITNLTANQVPADYGMDPKVVDDPARYSDDGSIDTALGITNRERIARGLRTLPALSLVIKNQDMWGAGGLYPTASESDKTDRTKACSLELLLPDGTTAFDVPCGIDLHGNASRAPYKNPKHGFTLRFKGRYGASELEAALFPGSPVRSWDKLVLRGDFNSSWLHQNGQTGLDSSSQRPRGIRIRDAWSKDTFRAMGRHAGRHRYTNLFINGLYWGTYDLAEDQDADFAASAFGGTKDDYDVIDQGVLKSGTWTAYRSMKTILGWTGPTQNSAPTATVLASPFTNAQYEQIKQYLDVPWFADYMLHHFFTGHQDWGTTEDYNKNWYAVRHRSGKFRYLPWDQENLLWGPTDNRVTGATYPPTAIHPRLRRNAEYRLDFADRVHRHCVAPDGALLPAANTARLDAWTSIMNADALCLESARWGDYRYKVHRYTSGVFTEVYTWNGRWYENGASRSNTANTNHWLAEINRLRSVYFPARTTNLLGQLRTAGLYPALNAPQCRDAVTDAVVGSRQVPAGWRVLLARPATPPNGTSNAGTIWFTTDGSDPRVSYDTTGTRSTTALMYTAPLTIDATTTVKARALDGTTWSALMEAAFTVGSTLPAVRFSEIHYNPPASQGGSACEFIEIHNTGTQPAPIGLWSFEGVEFHFAFDRVLRPGERAVVCSNDAPAVFAARYPGVIVDGTFSGSLNNSGERLRLLDTEGRQIDAVEFRDTTPWPIAADNGGASLERIAVDQDAQVPAHWKASSIVGGTPGKANSGAEPPGLQISEILVVNAGIYAIGGQTPGYVEIHNSAATPADASGWRLAFDQGGVFDFPSGTSLAPGERVLVHLAEAGTVAGWSLPPPPATHGHCWLADASGVTRDGLRFGPQAANWSFGRLDGQWRLGVPSPGGPTAPTAGAPAASLQLNEWRTAPPPGQSDWLEVYNAHPTLPAVLTGLEFGRPPERHRLQSLAAVAPVGRAVLTADAGSVDGDSLPFNLPAGGGTIVLEDGQGIVVDTVAFGPQPDNRSEGRLPDGAPSITRLAAPSPGLPNHGPFDGAPLLNEILPLNNTADNAPWGNRPSWIELLNPSSSPIDLSGWRVRDGEGAEFRIPAGPVLPPGVAIGFWCDPTRPASTQYSLAINTALSMASQHGGNLELLTPAGQTADSVTWGPSIPDRSLGRSPSGAWRLLSFPTRGRPNSRPAELGDASPLRLNEWLPATDGPLAEFIELYNPSTLPIEISGLWMSDEPSLGGRRKWQVPTLSFIPPLGRTVFGGGPGVPAAARYTFSLSSRGEMVRLGRNDAATSMLDEVEFGAWPANARSAGRQPDGSSQISFLQPTPGWANDPSEGPVFTLHPVAQSAPLGTTVVLAVATASPATYQWRRGGELVAGATEKELNVPLVSPTDGGEYVCEASNPDGTTVSRPARLTVLYSYALWSTYYQSGPSDGDDDGDGVENGIEFLTGSRPDQPDAAPHAFAAPVLTGFPDSPRLTLEAELDPQASFLNLTLESSATLDSASWAPVATAILEPVTSDSDRRGVRWEVDLPRNTARQFFRLHLDP